MSDDSFERAARGVMRDRIESVFPIDEAPRHAGATSIVERYAGATVEIPGGTVELGLQRGRGEPINHLRSEAKHIVAQCALPLNGDDVDEDSAARLSDRIEAVFADTWPGRAWWIEIWRAEERLTQVYHRWPLPVTSWTSTP